MQLVALANALLFIGSLLRIPATSMEDLRKRGRRCHQWGDRQWVHSIFIIYSI